MLPVLSSVPSEQEQHSVLQLLAEGSLYLLEQDTSDCLPFLYAFLLVSNQLHDVFIHFLIHNDHHTVQ